MAHGVRQPKWDVYEAAVLLEGYLESLQGNRPKTHIIREVSETLREMAVNRGITIDDVFRNYNGISYQIKSMESAYCGHTAYVPSTKLFDEIVEIYRSNQRRYFEILKEAKRMAMTPISNRDAFLAWASANLPAQQRKWIEENLLKIERFAVSTKLITDSIFDVSDISTLESIYHAAGKNVFFQIKNKKLIKHINTDFIAYIRFCSLKEETPESDFEPDAHESEESIADIESKKSLPSTNMDSDIASVLKQHYEYGFRYDSIRELMRFRQFADAMDIALPEEDEALKTAIIASGTIIEDKVYCKNDNMPRELQRMVDDIFLSENGMVYYESLFEKEEEWMETHVITSPDMLKEYLQKNVEGFTYCKKFMLKGKRRTEKEAVTDELKRVWGANPSNTVDELHNRLPYIPLGNIWRVISGNDLFVLVSEGEYLFIECFHITEDEENAILQFVKDTCEEIGFASLTDVPLGSIEEENYELTKNAIFNAIYKKVLSDKYYINGKILTKDKPELDIIALLKQFVKDRDECSFDEVADKVIELTGGMNRQYAFQVLYDDMVRVDKNRFVSTQYVNFDIDDIDSVLSGFITDNFRAIRDVTTFAMFPLCGQSWNHYLLESFCYKYSRKYSLHVIHFNDKNAGIIAEKDFDKKYNDMLAIALARTDIELTGDIVGQYLFNIGYMAKSKYSKLSEIVQKASELRKEGQ